jgi:hypothetical protein
MARLHFEPSPVYAQKIGVSLSRANEATASSRSSTSVLR